MALPAVVAIINELTPSQEQPGGIAGGAGVVLDERGFILTNAHIVALPGKLFVVLNNGEIRPATLVSHDAPFTDLAVLRIAPGGLRALPLGDSEALSPGQTVIAIGSPDIDYRNSVTVGVVSGLHRRKQIQGIWADDLIQTDAAINVGSSGGPLVNLRGEVVGVVTFRDVGADDILFGISFALSSNTIRPIAQSIIARGQFPRPYFGIEHQDLNDRLVQTANLRVNRGALVRRVINSSPAEKAGIQPGDVILRVGRNNIDESTPFINALSRLGVNDRVAVQVFRDGRAFDVTMELTAR
jgi:S1-C subfamily serine protease